MAGIPLSTQTSSKRADGSLFFPEHNGRWHKRLLHGTTLQVFRQSACGTVGSSLVVEEHVGRELGHQLAGRLAVLLQRVKREPKCSSEDMEDHTCMRCMMSSTCSCTADSSAAVLAESNNRMISWSIWCCFWYLRRMVKGKRNTAAAAAACDISNSSKITKQHNTPL